MKILLRPEDCGKLSALARVPGGLWYFKDCPLRMVRFVTSGLRLLLIAGVMQGCGSDPGVYLITPAAAPQALPPGSNLLPTGNLDYKVSPLDVLQVEIYPRVGELSRIDYGSEVRIELAFAGSSYSILPNDVIGIETSADPANSTQVVVRPDGRITLPHISRDITAAGLTPYELASAINDAYSATMKSPQTTVTVIRSDMDALRQIRGAYQVGNDGTIVVPALGSFKAVGQTATSLAARMEGVARAKFHNPVTIFASLGQLSGREVDPRIDPSGRSFFRGTAKVSPDGDLFVPPGGQIRVGGLTLPAARSVLLAALQPQYENPIDVSLSLSESGFMNVFIGGEVRQPGRYSYVGTMTLLKLIATSGWATEVGDLSRVFLLHQTSPGHYNVYRSNLQEVLDHGAIAQDLAIAPQDIVLVPMTTIGAIDKFIDQYIRRLIPVNAAATYSYITNPTGNTTAATPAR